MAYLDFTRCTGLTDVGFSYWSFQSFPNLEVLILSECIFLTDSTIRSVVNSCPNLAHLNLSFCCSLTDASIELLCVGCQKLEYLDISFCGRAVSDVSLLNTVSYTHLDVYKRQLLPIASRLSAKCNRTLNPLLLVYATTSRNTPIKLLTSLTQVYTDITLLTNVHTQISKHTSWSQQ